MNATNPTTSSITPEISICQALGEMTDPDKTTPVSLAVSFSAVVVNTFIFSLTIFANILILLAFYTKPSLRTKPSVLLCAMAAYDLARCAVGCPLNVAKEIAYQMRRQPNCYLDLILFNSLAPVSESLLTAVNCERFLGLKFPLWHRVHVTHGWLVCVAIGSFLIAQSSTILRSFVEKGAFLMISLFVGCTMATFVFVVLIWRVILRRNQQIHVQQQNQASDLLAMRSERKAAKIATYLAMAFLFTRIIPLLMLAFIKTKPDWMYALESLVKYLFYLNSFINPLIYGLMNQDIKRTCLELLKCN